MGLPLVAFRDQIEIVVSRSPKSRRRRHVSSSTEYKAKCLMCRRSREKDRAPLVAKVVSPTDDDEWSFLVR